MTTAHPATVTARPGSPLLDVVRDFDATPAQVFRAWAEPELVPQWLGPHEMAMDLVEYYVRPGGRYRYVHRDPDGREHRFRGVFHDVVAGERITQTFEWEGAPGRVSLDRTTFQDVGGRTRTHIRSVFPSVEARDAALAHGMERGVTGSMDRVAELLGARRGRLTVPTVTCALSMSLDGFVADPQDQVGPLFDRYFSGDVEIRPPGYPITYRMSEASARYWGEFAASTQGGALVSGRRLFDHTRGWGGRPPMGVPTFVVTHRPPPEDWPPRADAPFTFVTDGVASAVRQARAVARAGATVGVAGPDVARQCLEAGLLDEVRIDLVPVLLGAGVRYFDGVPDSGARFERLQAVEGDGVTHLRYRVRYP